MWNVNKVKQKIFNLFKELFTDNDKLSLLSFSFLLISLFLLILSFATPAKRLQSQRAYLCSFCFFIGFYMIPFLDMKQKDKTMFEFGKLFMFIFFGVLSFIYWFTSIKYTKVSWLSDILIILLSVSSAYYFLSKLFQIAKVFVKFINKLTSKIFPNTSSTSTGFKYIFEHFTAILISVSGALATILAIATSMKSIIGMFQK